MDILLFIGGLLLILGGANFLTDGAAAIAKKFGLSDFIVGLTIVSLMTSSPELVVSLVSAFEGASSIAIGNIVGSNIFNILVIVGLVAVIKPIKVKQGILTNDIPLVILSSIVLLVIGLSPALGAGEMVITRVSGIILLLFFVIFMRYTISAAKKTNVDEDESIEKETKIKQLPIWQSILYLLGGLSALIFGGQWFVDGATGVARGLGWSEGLIGLTIIACGTSMPELATSVVAARKGLSGICIGNVIGSNIFNIFLILGVSATIIPLEFGDITLFDLIVMTIASLLFWVFGKWFSKRTINRIEGVLMLFCYIAYIVYLYLNLPSATA
jgi:cation:H+ antiporter